MFSCSEGKGKTREGISSCVCAKKGNAAGIFFSFTHTCTLEGRIFQVWGGGGRQVVPTRRRVAKMFLLIGVNDELLPLYTHWEKITISRAKCIEATPFKHKFHESTAGSNVSTCSGLFYTWDADAEHNTAKLLVKGKKQKVQKPAFSEKENAFQKSVIHPAFFYRGAFFPATKRALEDGAWQDHHHHLKLCPMIKRCHLGPWSHPSCWEQAASQFGCWGMMTDHHPLQTESLHLSLTSPDRAITGPKSARGRGQGLCPFTVKATMKLGLFQWRGQSMVGRVPGWLTWNHPLYCILPFWDTLQLNTMGLV